MKPGLILKRSFKINLLILSLNFHVSSGWADDLEPPAGVDSPSSAMFSLEDIYQRLTTGASGTKRSGAFTGPDTEPSADTMYSLDDIMAVAPAEDAAAVSDEFVLAGLNYWS